LRRAPAAVPRRQLRVITDPGGIGRVMLDRIEEPTPADGVASLGYTDALVERSGAGQRAGKSKIAHHPAISLMIIKDEPIAIVEARTRRGYQGQEERVVGRSIWAIEWVTVFIKNLDRAVDRLDIVIRADIGRLRTGSVLCAHGAIVLLSRPCAPCLGEQRHSESTKAKDRSN